MSQKNNIVPFERSRQGRPRPSRPLHVAFPRMVDTPFGRRMYHRDIHTDKATPGLGTKVTFF